jgi:hypothetical protein
MVAGKRNFFIGRIGNCEAGEDLTEMPESAEEKVPTRVSRKC